MQYFEVLDLVAAYIRGRFDQQGHRFYVCHSLQDLLIKAANSEDYSQKYDSMLKFYC